MAAAAARWNGGVHPRAVEQRADAVAVARKQPRQHRFVGIVQAHKDKPNKPEYLILANVKNLCDFGDRLAKRLVQ